MTILKYLTTNAVLSTFDLPTITEIYNLIVTAKNFFPNNPVPLTITKLIASILVQKIWLYYKHYGLTTKLDDNS